jgi:hypothetical protein
MKQEAHWCDQWPHAKRALEMDYHLAGLSEDDAARHPRPGVVTVKCQRCESLQADLNAQRNLDVEIIQRLTQKVKDLETELANTNMMLNRSIGN